MITECAASSESRLAAADKLKTLGLLGFCSIACSFLFQSCVHLSLFAALACVLLFLHASIFACFSFSFIYMHTLKFFRASEHNSTFMVIIMTPAAAAESGVLYAWAPSGFSSSKQRK